ncbi:MAG: hypothetical protein JWR63_3563 [Conexibacter sp.]|nr:hypothetical protein [Conexibacter sp.]
MSAALFSALVALGREEHALVTDGRWDDLADLNARRERVLAALPAAAPAEALEDLREAARLQALSAAAMRQGMAETAAELRQVGTSRTGAAGYAAGTGAPAAPPAFNGVG